MSQLKHELNRRILLHFFIGVDIDFILLIIYRIAVFITVTFF